MKRWQKIALVAVNLAVLPLSLWMASSKNATTFDNLNRFVGTHMLVTALVAAAYHGLNQWRGSQRP